MIGNPDERERRLVSTSFHVVDARCSDAVSSMTAYFDELSERFPDGFDPGDTLVADAGTFDEPNGVFLIARAGEDFASEEVDGAVIGCGGVHHLDGPYGEIKRMWVHPDQRGIGLGKRLLSTLEQHGSRLGFGVIRLDTNSVLTEAIRMYESAGYHEIERYNDNPFAKHWFEKTL